MTEEAQAAVEIAPQQPMPLTGGNVDNTLGNTPPKQTVAEVMAELDAIDTEIAADEPTEEIPSEFAEEATEEAEQPTEQPVEATEEKPAEESGEEAEEAPVAVLKAKSATGEDIDVPEDAVFKVKVSGEEEDVTQAELIKNYQGKKPWEKYHHQSKEDRKQLDTEKLEFLAERQKFQNHKIESDALLSDIAELAEDDPTKALLMVTKRLGRDPSKMLHRILKQAEVTANELTSLSKDELENKIRYIAINQKEEFLKDREKGKEQAEAKKQEMLELDNYIRKQWKEHGITEEEYAVSQRGLENALREGVLDVAGKTAKEIVDMVMDHTIQYVKPHGRIASVARDIDPKLAEDLKFIKQLHRKISDESNRILPEFKDSDIADIIKGYLGKTDTPKETPKDVTVPATESSTGSPERAEPGKTDQQREELASDTGDDSGDPITFEDLMAPYK